jgi:hypothetical protein
VHDSLIRDLESNGYSIVDGVGTAAKLVDFACTLGTIYEHRDSSTDGITYIRPKDNVGTQAGFSGFSRKALPPHTDRSNLGEPPRLLLMAWTKEAVAGGDLGLYVVFYTATGRRHITGLS